MPWHFPCRPPLVTRWSLWRMLWPIGPPCLRCMALLAALAEPWLRARFCVLCRRSAAVHTLQALTRGAWQDSSHGRRTCPHSPWELKAVCLDLGFDCLSLRPPHGDNQKHGKALCPIAAGSDLSARRGPSPYKRDNSLQDKSPYTLWAPSNLGLVRQVSGQGQPI